MRVKLGLAGATAGGTGNDRYENDEPCAAAEGSNVNLGNGHDVALVSYARHVQLGNGNDRFESLYAPGLFAGSGNDHVSVQDGAAGAFDLGSGHDRLSSGRSRSARFSPATETTSSTASWTAPT
jgi:hypothetical protein